MSKHFAQLDNQGIVQRVIVADSLDWCVQHLGGQWVETFKNEPTKNFAGIGHVYYQNGDNFATEKPFESWELDSTFKWQAPKPMPKTGLMEWSEEKQEWTNLTLK